MSIDTKRTKIVCTIGPASSNKEIIKEFIKAGMNVARINFSHGDDKSHLDLIKIVKDSAKELNAYVGVLADLKGPKIRVGKFENSKEAYNAKEKIDIYYGDKLGNHSSFYINQKELFSDVKIGDKLLVDDGKVILKILKTSNDYMQVEVQNDGVISNNKGINAPGVILTMPFVSEKDYNDILLAIKARVNAVASSFVRRKQDILDIRKILDENGGNDIDIIAKIENQEGFDNIEDILSVASGVMVARGDMGVEVPIEVVPVYQKRLIKAANEKGKPVITATHMLESMINCPLPTRAEASDVANACLDGTDAVMLSGESAVGEYPIEAVKTMANILREAEKLFDYSHRFNRIYSYNSVNDAIGASVAQCCLTLKKAEAVFAFTETGGTARRISHYRPSLPIIACSNSERALERIAYYWGVYPVLVDSLEDLKEFDEIAIKESLNLGIKKGSVIIMTSGYGMKHGETNTIRLLTI